VYIELNVHRVQEKSKPKCFCHVFYKTQPILIKAGDQLSGINLLQSTANVCHITLIMSLRYLVEYKIVSL